MIRMLITEPVAWALACSDELMIDFWDNLDQAQQARAEKFAWDRGWMDENRRLTMVGCQAIEQIKADYAKATQEQA